jgi:arylsulfatase A-like enzyme
MLTSRSHLLTLVAVLVLVVAFVDSAVADETKPNVLFIVVDDMNDWVGCLDGHPQSKTPNMDRLAACGVLFTNAHCQGPICGPSRASLFSGFYPHTTGLYQQPNGEPMEADEKFFKGHLMPEYFAQHGYETFAVGKTTHGYRPVVAFDHYGGNFEGSGPKPPNKHRFNYHLPDVPWTGTQTDWGAFPDVDEKMPDFKSADWAIQTLNQPHQKPFFLAVGFHRPHVPFYVPQKWFDQFPLDEIKLPSVQNDDLDDVPEIGRLVHEMPKYPKLAFLQANKNEQFRKCVQAYLACNMFVDHQVGRVIDALEKSDYADNTVIVLFSDHGYHLGEKNRVSKHSLWEESTRVPMMFVPNRNSKVTRAAAGTHSSKPVELLDIYPTLTELCGLPAKTSNEGRSLVPLMDDPETEWKFAALTTYARKCHALRSDRYRYIRYEDGSEELYDHEIDPEEWDNVAGEPEFAELVMRFRFELPKQDAPYHPATKKGPVNQWFKDHLEKNGIK